MTKEPASMDILKNGGRKFATELLEIDYRRVDLKKLEKLRVNANVPVEKAAEALGATQYGWEMYVINSTEWQAVDSMFITKIPTDLELLSAKPEDVYRDSND